jgi:hypothetical protein
MRTRLTLTTIMIGMLTALAAVAAITVLKKPSPALAQGATQISGIAFFAEPGECNADPEGEGSDFALRMTGDLEGCHYVFVEDAGCSPSGTYRELGTEIFVGYYNGALGTFKTTYQFTAKYENCPNLIGEIFGRCQHPLIVNSGTGGFEGFTGRIDFKDDVEAGNFPYRGHLHR